MHNHHVIIIYYLLNILCAYLLLRMKTKKYKQKRLEDVCSKYSLEDFNIKKVQKVRKHWLISFFLLIVLGPTIANLPWYVITYYCAYKKEGTVWLLWTMITYLLGALFALILMSLDWNVAVQKFRELDGRGWLMTVLSNGFQILFWFNCLRLYKINRLHEYKNKFTKVYKH